MVLQSVDHEGSECSRQYGWASSDDGFYGRFHANFQRRRQALNVGLSVIGATIGMSERNLRLLLEGKGKKGPTWQDIEAIDSFFASLGEPGFIEDVRLRSRVWTVTPLSLPDHRQLPEFDLLVQGLRETTLDHLQFLKEKGVEDKVHLLELDESDHLHITHIGASVPLRLGPEVMHKDLRELSDPEFGCVVHRQMMAISATGRIGSHKLISECVTYSRLTLPLDRGRRPGNKRRLATIPFEFQMTVERFELA
jgi:hypothetical protein